MFKSSSSYQAQTGLATVRLTTETRILGGASAPTDVRCGYFRRRIWRGTLTLFVLLAALAGTACAILGVTQATNVSTTPPKCVISIQWPGATQGAPLQSTPGITVGTNLQGVPCHLGETQANNSKFLSDINAALHMTAKQLEPLQVRFFSKSGKAYPTWFDLEAGSAGLLAKLYRVALVSSTVVEIMKTGQIVPTKIGIVAFVAAVTGKPFVFTYQAPLGGTISLGLDQETYPESAFSPHEKNGSNFIPFVVPFDDFIAATQQQFDPNTLLKPKYDTDGVKNVNLQISSIVDIGTQNKWLEEFLDTEAGNNEGKSIDMQAAYRQTVWDAQQDSLAYVPPVFSPGATQQDIDKMVVFSNQGSVSSAYDLSVVSLRDAVRDFVGAFEALFPESKSSQIPISQYKPEQIRLNGVETTAYI